MKSILALVGSGTKNGNTDKLTNACIQGATAAGHHVERVFMGNLDIQGCRGCGGSTTKKRIDETDALERAYAFGKSL